MSTICLTNCKLFLKEKFDEKTQRSHCVFKARDGNHYKKQEAKSDRIKIQILRLVAEKVQWERVANLPVMMFPNFHYYFSVFVFSATKRRDKLKREKKAVQKQPGSLRRTKKSWRLVRRFGVWCNEITFLPFERRRVRHAKSVERWEDSRTQRNICNKNIMF